MGFIGFTDRSKLPSKTVLRPDGGLPSPSFLGHKVTASKTKSDLMTCSWQFGNSARSRITSRLASDGFQSWAQADRWEITYLPQAPMPRTQHANTHPRIRATRHQTYINTQDVPLTPHDTHTHHTPPGSKLAILQHSDEAGQLAGIG